ncbi:MAG: hypothetical protein ACI4BD_01375 [Paludibacteraceae bacterium]
MKKLCSLLLAFMAASFSYTASALTLKFNVDVPERVKFEYNYMEVTLADDGTLTLDKNSYGYYEYLYIKLQSSEFVFTSCTCTTNSELSFWGGGSSYYYRNPDDTWDKSEWTVTTANLEDLRTDSCVMVIIGDVNKVRFQRKNSTTVTLSDTTTIKYNPSTEVPFQIGYNGYGSSLYKVELNNNAVTASYGTYSVTPTSATDTIRVTTDAPADAKVPFTFSFVNDGTSGCVDSVLVNGEKVTNWADDDFSVAWGAKVDIYFNTTDYGVKYKWSTDSYWNTAYSTFALNSAVNDSYTLEIDATKYEDYHVTLNVTKPELMTLTVGSRTLSLTEGENDVTFNTANTTLQIAPKTDCRIVSVMDNAGTTYTGSSSISVDTKTLTSVTIVADSIRRDKQFVLYIDDISKSGNCYYLTLGDYSYRFYYTGWNSGYNVINFAEAENNHTIYVYNTDNGGYWYAGYKNDVALEGSYNYQFSYQTIADGDVYKVFLAAAPETLEVSMNVSDAVEEDDDVLAALEEGIAIKKDIITEVDYFDLFGGIEVLTGTQVDITLGTELDLVIGYNEAVYAPDENGICHITVVADGELVIMKASEVSTAMQQTSATVKATKIVRDGRVLIIRGEEAFDVLGNVVVR